ncbi:3-hydroxyacyl-ACP dehydratase FabZ family protein [Tuwongella immobilis]|uniref:Beta-hydroxyacyl-ACP dehydratase n=1 Tax=Tuwongella immobilis TaxID=692036 RepID=A0A6C2YGF3_9BACT|nr:3-hydroxyacyl-ACP dehydratase FabZ family protein [Tuwongella immobilis]VIP00600.1 hydroxymyristoyl-acp dehydratase : Probable hydroxymyristoyl-(Acyl carrier protein) dehydratase OS=Blastopirellula marina DSM 3645 GN=DSM3645_13425 PE=4 SV=1: FabA [Tuwongella immobilis]VTR96618.1 hydroxymyristoyl-acp dehydratase : Probable hydroxymyristoyl-(Acyl carrier protein) dehydratase OS=Blastopirellula marina DSM 3645 GN=DSM3645_13425 PE=4 SV=1: FabA [Tuwongella immobilis]
MRFQLIDELSEWTPGKKLTAKKLLTLGEEYLGDHFPGFPVMPGVLMLEALTEASAWLWRLSENYATTVIVLREVKGVKYGNFMKPGYCLDLQTELVKLEGGLGTFKGKGSCEGQLCVSAQLILAGYTLESKHPDRAEEMRERDSHLRDHWKQRLGVLTTSPASWTLTPG